MSSWCSPWVYHLYVDVSLRDVAKDQVKAGFGATREAQKSLRVHPECQSHEQFHNTGEQVGSWQMAVFSTTATGACGPSTPSGSLFSWNISGGLMSSDRKKTTLEGSSVAQLDWPRLSPRRFGPRVVLCNLYRERKR